jgi:hypothetical protein
MTMNDWGVREQLEAQAMGWDIFQCDRGERTFEIEVDGDAEQLEGDEPSSARIALSTIKCGAQAGWWYYSIDGAHNDFTFYHRGPCVRAAEKALKKTNALPD